ncbi:hypothetical protein F4806DRAFT_504073 [Annulohypoxylon nitens]|nr:hypothetical protein F4806DRAFT_504073 [Annulohypoxylon nitens]
MYHTCSVHVHQSGLELEDPDGSRPKPQPDCMHGSCRVNKNDMPEKFPALKVFPRPEPPIDQDDHESWIREYNQWGSLRCACGRGYFCREHGDWISGEEVGSGLAVAGDNQKRGSCPIYHYQPQVERDSYVGHRDAAGLSKAQLDLD